MEMIEIDPQLFVTCRLCVENLGVYQIVPSVQQQIKNCFDIEVDPFDGLPQLICKNCESVLSKYVEIKNNYIKKQQSLKEKIKNKTLLSRKAILENDQDAVTSSQQVISEDKNEVRDIDSITLNDSYSDKSSDSESVAKPYKRIKTPRPGSWERIHHKWYVCRFCGRNCKTSWGITQHTKTHRTLLDTHNKLINKYCTVNLNRSDTEPNLCMSEQIVVHATDKVIKSVDNFYYIIYKAKKNIETSKDKETSLIESESLPTSNNTHDSSDSEPIFKKKRKRPRFVSESSCEDIVINEDSMHSSNSSVQSTLVNNVLEPLNTLDTCSNEILSLEDNSDYVTNKTNSTNSQLNVSLKEEDCKIIQSIISVCFKKYLNRLEANENGKNPMHIMQNHQKTTNSALKAKLLSFGRKIINNSNINCTGILRYLEFKNLEVVWIPRLLTEFNKKFDPVQVMVRLKDDEKSDVSDLGLTVSTPVNNTSKSEDINLIEDQTSNEVACNDPCLVTIYEKEETREVIKTELEHNISSNNSTSDKDCHLKKLLNANPVENPKQLPKKLASNEFHSVSQAKIIKKTTKKTHSDPPVTVNEETADGQFSMPIITSTISLAPQNDTQKKARQKNDLNPKPSQELISSTTPNIKVGSSNETSSLEENKEVPKKAPWIKVKPVSELMSDQALNTLNQQIAQQSNPVIQNRLNVAYQNSSNIVFMKNITVPLQGSSSAPLDIQLAESSSTEVSNNPVTSAEYIPLKFVILDSDDLPHTRTDSPFRYFKSLLSIHNITLLDANENSLNDFICLLKFKLVFQQDGNLPVVLCMALFYWSRQFYLEIKDIADNDLDVTRLSANWQWEILKMYLGDINLKLLENAKKISREAYDCTNVFLCLLRGIKYRKLP